MLTRVSSVAAAALLIGTPLLASSFQVQSANANTGTQAARLTVTKTCTPGDATIPDGPLSSDPVDEPCGILTANNVDVVAGPVRFKAGQSLLLGEGFSVASGVSFVAEVGASVLGDAAVRDETPQALRDFHLRFYINPDNLTLSADSQQFDHLVAYDAQGNREFLIGLTFNSVLGERRLYTTAFENDGTALTTKDACELALDPGWQFVEAHWKASTGTDGDVEVGVNGVVSQSLVSCLSVAGGLDNASGEISAVEWGVRNLSSGSLGSIDLDDFASSRTGPIGGAL